MNKKTKALAALALAGALTFGASVPAGAVYGNSVRNDSASGTSITVKKGQCMLVDSRRFCAGVTQLTVKVGAGVHYASVVR